jgi:Glutaredoxin-like domain (DUF836)
VTAKRTSSDRAGPEQAGPEQADPAHIITLLSRPGCHLCDDARTIIARVAADLGVSWTERDITQSADDMHEYGEMIPVILIDGIQHDFWRVDERRLRTALGS